MIDKIKVYIYGVENEVVGRECGSKHSSEGCSGCSSGCSSKGHSCGGCSSSSSKTTGELFREFEKFIKDSDVKDNTEIVFIDLNEDKNQLTEDVLDVIERGFTAPITEVDGIIRFYGGIPNEQIYKDIKEMIEYYEEKNN